MVEVRYSPRAALDLKDIHAHIAKENEAAAGRVIAHLRRRIGLLKRDPLMGKAHRTSRFLVLHPVRYPYRIYYEVLPTCLLILHVRHTARKEPRLRGFHEE